MDQRIAKALETWHGGEDEKGRINCYLSMAGELGEIINLYRKLFFKPGYNSENINREVLLDEWGDFWYYVRLFAHFNKLDIPELNFSYSDGAIEGISIHNLVLLDREVSQILENELGILEGELDEKETLQELVIRLGYFLFSLNCSLDELTDLNYQKLTKNADHHGWKEVQTLISNKNNFAITHGWIDEQGNERIRILSQPQEEDMGIDHAKGKDKLVVGFWKVEEDGSTTLLGTSDESYEELKQKLSQEDFFKMLYECQPVEDKRDWKSKPPISVSELTEARNQLTQTEFDKLYLNEWPPVQAEEDITSDQILQTAEKALEDTFDSEEDLEDWREEMQKRIKERERISRELRGRWY